MDYRLVSLYLTTLLFTCLFILVVIKGVKSFGKILYSFHILNVLIWTFGLAMFYQTRNLNTALRWSNILYFAGGTIPVTFLHFSYIFPAGTVSIPKYKQYLIYLPNTILFILFFFTPLMIKEVSVQGSTKVFIYGKAHLLWDLHFSTIFIIAFWRFFIIYRKSTGVQKMRLRYILAGTFMAVILAGTTNVFMPSWFHRCEYIWLGPCFSLIWLACVVYAITQYQLMDIRLVVREGLVYMPYFLILSLVFVPVFMLVYNSMLLTISTAIGLIVIAPFIYNLLKKRSRTLIDELIFSGEYNYVKKLEEFIEKMIFIHEEKELIKITTEKLARIFNVKKVSIFTFDNINNSYLIRAMQGQEQIEDFRIHTNNSIIYWLRKNNEVFVREEMEKVLEKDKMESIKEVLDKVSADVCVPVILEKDLEGIIFLSEKTSGEMYSHIDTRILKRMGSHLAVTLNHIRTVAELNKERQQAEITKNRLNAITTMSYGLADRMRNDLQAIYAFIGDLPNKIKELKDTLPANIIESLENHYKASSMGVDKLIKLATEITSVCKPTSENPQRHDPKTIIELADEAEKELESEMQNKEIKIEKVITGTPPATYFDKEAVKRVLWNLIQNSIHAIHGTEKGLIKITVTGPVKRNEIEFLRIIVEDNGVGIPSENLENIFNPFYTTKGTAGGLGLGLTICQFIVNQHEGIIEVAHSELDKGTAIHVDLPVRSEPPKATVDYKDILGEFPLRKKKGGLDEIKGIIDKIIGEPPSGERQS